MTDPRVRVTPGVDTLFRVWRDDEVVLATDDMDAASQRAKEERRKLRPAHVRFADACDRLGRQMIRVSLGALLIGLGLAVSLGGFPIGLLFGVPLALAGVGVIGGGRS
ncbi:MAG TPA: hypothetical protein VF156_15575 [Agromyces sp.]